MLEVSFNNRSYISAEEKPPDSSFGEVRYKDKNFLYFKILDSLL